MALSSPELFIAKGMPGDFEVNAQPAYAPEVFIQGGRADAAPEVARLPEGWICGRNCDIGGPPGRPVRVDYVLMHPQLGVALVERESRVADAEGVLRRRLAEAQFQAIFSGHLPILHGSVEASEMASLVEVLAEAFAGLPPLTVAGGGSWVGAVARAVVPADRVWADNLEGALARTAEGRHALPPGDRAGWSGRPTPVAPLRRVAGIPRPEARQGEGDAVSPEAPRDGAGPIAQRAPGRSWIRWTAAGVASLTAVALACAVAAWKPAPTAAPAAPEAPAQARAMDTTLVGGVAAWSARAAPPPEAPALAALPEPAPPRAPALPAAPPRKPAAAGARQDPRAARHREATPVRHAPASSKAAQPVVRHRRAARSEVRG